MSSESPSSTATTYSGDERTTGESGTSTVGRVDLKAQNELGAVGKLAIAFTTIASIGMLVFILAILYHIM